MGRNARIDPTVRVWAPWNLSVGEESSLGHHVDCYNVAPVYVGEHATVSQHAFLCTASHDVSDPHMRLVSAPIHIDAGAWVCAAAYIAPGVRVGIGGVAAACAVVTKDVPDWTIVGGNPARFIRERTLRSGSPEGE